MQTANDNSKFELQQGSAAQTDLVRNDIKRLRERLRTTIGEMQCCEEELKQIEEKQEFEPRY